MITDFRRSETCLEIPGKWDLLGNVLPKFDHANNTVTHTSLVIVSVFVWSQEFQRIKKINRSQWETIIKIIVNRALCLKFELCVELEVGLICL